MQIYREQIEKKIEHFCFQEIAEFIKSKKKTHRHHMPKLNGNLFKTKKIVLFGFCAVW